LHLTREPSMILALAEWATVRPSDIEPSLPLWTWNRIPPEQLDENKDHNGRISMNKPLDRRPRWLPGVAG
jgi:hypothetical protein